MHLLYRIRSSKSYYTLFVTVLFNEIIFRALVVFLEEITLYHLKNDIALKWINLYQWDFQIVKQIFELFKILMVMSMLQLIAYSILKLKNLLQGFKCEMVLFYLSLLFLLTILLHQFLYSYEMVSINGEV